MISSECTSKQVNPIRWTAIENLELYLDLNKIPNGSTAQQVLRLVDKGLPREKFGEFKKKPWFNKALKTILEVEPKATEEVLEGFADYKSWVNKFADELPWSIIDERYPCLLNGVPDGNACGCGEIKPPQIIYNVLRRAEIRSRLGGFYADRLLTAISLGASLEEIENCRLIHVEAALKILGKDRVWLVAVAGSKASSHVPGTPRWNAINDFGLLPITPTP